jgi:hypothetical protein
MRHPLKTALRPSSTNTKQDTAARWWQPLRMLKVGRNCLLVSLLLLLLLLLLGACTFQGTKRPSLKLSVQQLNQHVLLS